MQIKNILVIRFRRVGDSVLSMALCHGLRQSFPDATIDFVIKNYENDSQFLDMKKNEISDDNEGKFVD